MKKNRVPFIVIDGQDGSGKGTQIKLLRSRLTQEGKRYGEDFIFTREPGGVLLSEDLRTVIKSDAGMSADTLTQFLMFWAARNAWHKQCVVPALERGVVVFSDRGDSSTFAYQIRAGNAPTLANEFWRMRELVFGDHAPTQYIIVDVPAEEARRRSLSASDGEHATVFDMKEVEFYDNVRSGLLEFAGINSSGRIVDGVGDPQFIHGEIYAYVSSICGWQ